MTRKEDFFKTFCKISRALGTTLNREKLLNLIIDSAIEAMNGKAACLFYADEKKDLFVTVAQKGLSKKYLHAKPMQARKVVKGMVKEGYLAAHDATSDPRLENHAAKQAEGIASILAVPVVVKDKTIGVLSLYMAEPTEFSRDEIDFMSALADHGGMAIERSRMMERINRNATLFLDLAQAINASLDIKKVFHHLTAEIADALGMKGVSIRLLDEEQKRLQLVASYGLSEDFLAKGPISAEKSVAQVLKGETVVIKDAATDDRIQYKQSMAAEGIASMLCVPMKARNEVIGAMRLYSRVKRDFPSDVLMLVNALAHTGGLAINNASCYLALEDDMRDLQQDVWSHRSWF